MARLDENKVFIGTAGWTIPKQLQSTFSEAGTHLERYARRFNCVEINSSFYREHKPETYAKWADATPDGFRFSVKLSRHFTQNMRLKETGPRLKEVLEGISNLKNKWGALLVQLPPSLAFEHKVAENFMGDLRALYSGSLFWEPRHKTWAQIEALELMSKYQVNKVLADPEPCRVSAALRTKVEHKKYFRLHGSPEIYKSRYSPEAIERIANAVAHDPALETWIIFDNTTFGFATENALELQEILRG